MSAPVGGAGRLFLNRTDANGYDGPIVVLRAIKRTIEKRRAFSNFAASDEQIVEFFSINFSPVCTSPDHDCPVFRPSTLSATAATVSRVFPELGDFRPVKETPPPLRQSSRGLDVASVGVNPTSVVRFRDSAPSVDDTRVTSVRGRFRSKFDCCPRISKIRNADSDAAL